MTYEQLAEALEVPANQVGTIVRRARQRLANRIGKVLAALPEDLRPDLEQNAGGGPSLNLLIKPEVLRRSSSESDGAGPDGQGGYKDAERKDLQRLLETAK